MENELIKRLNEVGEWKVILSKYSVLVDDSKDKIVKIMHRSYLNCWGSENFGCRYPLGLICIYESGKLILPKFDACGFLENDAEPIRYSCCSLENDAERTHYVSHDPKYWSLCKLLKTRLPLLIFKDRVFRWTEKSLFELVTFYYRTNFHSLMEKIRKCENEKYPGKVVSSALGDISRIKDRIDENMVLTYAKTASKE